MRTALRAIDGWGWAALALSGLLLLVFFGSLFPGCAVKRNVEARLLCAAPVPTPFPTGPFPCTLADGKKAVCKMGGGSYSNSNSNSAPKVAPPSGDSGSDFQYQFGYNVIGGGFGFGFGANGINLIPIGPRMGGYE